MPKKARELSAKAVAAIRTPGLHAVGGVDGLALQVTDTGARSWILRYTAPGTAKRRQIGLGPYPEVALADARDAARAARAKVRAGVDPIDARQAARSEPARASFAQCVDRFLESKAGEWRNEKHAAQWRSTLTTYAVPIFGALPVESIDTQHVLAAIEPLWRTKTETASRLRGRIESVLDWASARKLRSGDNPARWRGHLDHLLPRPSKLKRVRSHPAVPIDEAPALYSMLATIEGMAARALRFVMLTAARSGEVRGATWSEIDFDSALWTIPAARMKAGREHRVPLCDDAIALLRDTPKIAGSKFVFPAARGGQLSDMALLSVMRRHAPGYVPHGLRSTFRDWIAERTDYSNHVAEMALAHAIGNDVEAAYRRGDLLDKRRQLMRDWAAFLRGQDGG